MTVMNVDQAAAAVRVFIVSCRALGLGNPSPPQVGAPAVPRASVLPPTRARAKSVSALRERPILFIPVLPSSAPSGATRARFDSQDLGMPRFAKKRTWGHFLKAQRGPHGSLESHLVQRSWSCSAAGLPKLAAFASVLSQCRAA